MCFQLFQSSWNSWRFYCKKQHLMPLETDLLLTSCDAGADSGPRSSYEAVRAHVRLHVSFALQQPHLTHVTHLTHSSPSLQWRWRKPHSHHDLAGHGPVCSWASTKRQKAGGLEVTGWPCGTLIVRLTTQDYLVQKMFLFRTAFTQGILTKEKSIYSIWIIYTWFWSLKYKYSVFKWHWRSIIF